MGREAGEDVAHLVVGHQRGDVELHAGLGETADERAGEFALGIGHGDFHIDIRAPGRDFAGLFFHLGEVVGEDLERHGPAADDSENLAGKGLVVGYAGLAHERRVGGEALDERVRREGGDAFEVRAVGEDFYLEITDWFHRDLCLSKLRSLHCPRIIRPASGSDFTVKSGASRSASA